MKLMWGIDYDKNNTMWRVFELKMCDCGNHFDKSFVRADTKKEILKFINEGMDKVGA